MFILNINFQVSNRLNSIRQLTMIATALGPQRTRDELIPYLGGMQTAMFYLLGAMRSSFLPINLII